MSDSSVEKLNTMTDTILSEGLLTEEQLNERIETVDSILAEYGFVLESESVEGYVLGLQEMLETYEFEADDQAELEEGFFDVARAVAGTVGSAASRVRQGYQKGMQAAGAVSGAINRVKANVQTVKDAFATNANKHVVKDANGNAVSGGKMYGTQRGISSVGGNANDAAAAHAAVTANAEKAGVSLSGADKAKAMAYHQAQQDATSHDFHAIQQKDANAKFKADQRAKKNAEMLAKKQAATAKKQADAAAAQKRDDVIKGRVPAKPSNSPLNQLPPPSASTQQTPSGARLGRM